MAPKSEKRVIFRVAFFVGLLSLLIASCKEGGFTALRYPGFVGFDDDTDGWRVSQGGTIGYSLTSGNPGGFLYGDDAGGSAWYFIASDGFVTEAQKAYGRSLRFDLKQEMAYTKADNITDVVLTDGKVILTCKTAYKPATTWTNYAIRLDELSGWKKGSALATKTDMQAVLQHLTGLRIRGDYKAGPDGEVWIMLPSFRQTYPGSVIPHSRAFSGVY